MPALCNLLQDEASTARHSCWALINLIDSSAQIKLFTKHSFDVLIKALYDTAQRSDMQTAAFSAMATLIEKSAEDCAPSIVSSIDGFVGLLQQSTGSGEALQNALCNILRACFHRSTSQDIPEDLADRYMQALLSLFTIKNGPTEEGLQSLSAFAQCVEAGF